MAGLVQLGQSRWAHWFGRTVKDGVEQQLEGASGLGPEGNLASHGYHRAIADPEGHDVGPVAQ